MKESVQISRLCDTCLVRDCSGQNFLENVIFLYEGNKYHHWTIRKRQPNRKIYSDCCLFTNKYREPLYVANDMILEHCHRVGTIVRLCR